MITTTIIRLDPRIDPQADRAHLEQHIAEQHPDMEIIHAERGKMVIAPKDRPPYRVSETSGRETVTLGDRANERTGGELDNYIAGAYQGRRLVSWDQVHRRAEIAHLHPQVAELRGWLASTLNVAPWHLSIVLSIDPATNKSVELELGVEPSVYRPETHEVAVEAWLAKGQAGEHCRRWTVRANPRTGKIVAKEWPDPLRHPIGALPIPEALDMRVGPQIGWTETGDPWHIPLLETHTLLAGASGSGKGSVIWSYLRGCIPAIRAGQLEVWGIDLKGGVEFSLGREFFTRLATDAEAAAELLSDAVAVMQLRLADLVAGRSRKHQPAVGDPTVLVMIDEMAAITSYVTDAALKKQIAGDLALLLTQGRAPGILVFGALQDPKKETLPQRDSFFARVLLRMLNEQLVDNILGDGAIAAGAETWRIPPTSQGVGYVMTTDPASKVESLSRVRAAFVDDDELKAMAADLGARPQSVFAARLRAKGPAGPAGAARRSSAPLTHTATPTWSKDADNSALLAALRDTSDMTPPTASAMPAAVEAAADADEPLTFNPEDWE